MNFHDRHHFWKCQQARHNLWTQNSQNISTYKVVNTTRGGCSYGEDNKHDPIRRQHQCDLIWQKSELDFKPFLVIPSPRCPCLTCACFPGSPWSGTTQKSSSRGRRVLHSLQRRLRPVPHTRPAWPSRMMNALRRRNILLWCEGKGRLTHLAGETGTHIQT